MKIIIWIIAAINIYFGGWSFLNVINVLQTSKYSQGATTFFAVIFLAMGVASIYFLMKGNNKLALLIGVGPWLLSLLFLVANLIFSDYK
ncbi:MAG TPA: hypothetical protein VKT28_20825 [Puia sp.]|nr:hypothetical protein [Puia sp.]